jgi:ribonuclease R
LPDALMTGVVHVSTLTDDFYRFDAAQRRLIGRRTNRRYAIGDAIKVFVARVDTFKQQIDFAVADATRGKKSRRQ